MSSVGSMNIVVTPVSVITVDDGPIRRSSAAISRQQRKVNVDTAARRCAQKFFRQDAAIGYNDRDLRVMRGKQAAWLRRFLYVEVDER